MSYQTTGETVSELTELAQVSIAKKWLATITSTITRPRDRTITREPKLHASWHCFILHRILPFAESTLFSTSDPFLVFRIRGNTIGAIFVLPHPSQQSIYGDTYKLILLFQICQGFPDHTFGSIVLFCFDCPKRLFQIMDKIVLKSELLSIARTFELRFFIQLYFLRHASVTEFVLFGNPFFQIFQFLLRCVWKSENASAMSKTLSRFLSWGGSSSRLRFLLERLVFGCVSTSSAEVDCSLLVTRSRLTRMALTLRSLLPPSLLSLRSLMSGLPLCLPWLWSVLWYDSS